MNPRVCPACGNRTRKRDKFCSNCGQDLGKVREDKSEEVSVGEPPPSAKTLRAGAQKISPSTIIWLCVAAVALAGIIAGVIFFLHRPPRVEMPKTKEELAKSIGEARLYLTSEGRRLESENLGEGASVYSVSVNLDPAQKFLKGKEYVLFRNNTRGTLREVVFRFYPARPSGSEDEKASISDVEVDGKEAKGTLNGSILKVNLPKPLKEGEDVLISLSFMAEVPEVQPAGIGSSQPETGYGLFGHGEKTYNLGYSFPIVTSFGDGSWDSREVPPFGDVADFPCAYFSLSIEVPHNYIVAATGKKLDVAKRGGRAAYKFAAGPVRDMAVQASPAYEFSSRKIGETTVTSYFLRGSREAGMNFLDEACKSFEQFSAHFGGYPFKNLNLCEAPLGGGAAGMEFTGQILLCEALYGDSELLEGEEVPEMLREFMDKDLFKMLKGLGGGVFTKVEEFTIAHEVAHQWWAIAVGNDPIEHPFQDESLANYCAVLYFKWAHGEKEAQRQLQTQIILPYKTFLFLEGGDGVVDSPAPSFKNEEEYIAMVYSKGALFFNELEKRLGEAAFLGGLKNYYLKFAFKSAQPEDLLIAFQTVSSDPGGIAFLWQRWIKEKHGAEDIGGVESLRDLLEDSSGEFFLPGGPLDDMLKDFFLPEEKPDSEVPVPGEQLPI